MSTTAGDRSSLRLPGEAASVPAARRFLAERTAGLDAETQETAVFLLSEVVTNAVLHARTAVAVRCTTQPGGVLVEVRDDNPLVPLPRQHDEDAVTGRGLQMVEMLADAFGVVPDASGKTVWFAVGRVPAALPTGWSPPTETDVVRVVLLSLPVPLWDVLQQHNELLLREYELALLAAGADASVRRDVAAVGRARSLVVEAIKSTVRREREARRLDVSFEVPEREGRGLALLPQVLDEAEAAARRGETLARPALPELLELRDWLYGEITRQLDGRPPQPWRAVTSFVRPPAAPTADADVSWVARSLEAVVVADDANRILAVSEAAADLLGWTPAALVGERVTVIIPERLRENHVTGFVRHLVTGRRYLIGRTVEVPALRPDGSEVAVRLTLERESVGGRSLYVARLGAGDPGS